MLKYFLVRALVDTNLTFQEHLKNTLYYENCEFYFEILADYL